MLHNRPHLGQGGSPGLPAPPLGGALWGQVLRGASLYPTYHLLPPPLGGPHVGHWPIHKYLEGEREGWGYSCLIRIGRGIMSYFMPFPNRGRDTVIALLYWPPPLSVIALSSRPSRV